MKLRIAEDLAVPLDVVTEKLAWLGRTGSGKTYGAMKLAELMLAAGAQVGVLDPVGVWRALRVPAAQDGRSFEVVVFGGLYADLPLEPTAAAGELVADLVVDRNLAFVLDVSQFIPAEQQRFVRAFADRFFHRKKSKPSAVHLFMEECQEFIPENPSGLEAQTLGAMQRLWKLGRNFGIGGSLISQRPQEIAKKALNMSGTLFAFQMTGPQERKAIKAWVADHGVALDIESVLQKLRVGHPHVESPTFLNVSRSVYILPRVTADLSSTPKVGASTAAARPLTPIDLERLKVSMAETIERAKAEDPKALQARIRQLEQELARARKEKPEPERVEVAILQDDELERLETAIEGLRRFADVLTERSASVAHAVSNAAQVVVSAMNAVRLPAPARRETPAPLPATARTNVHQPAPARTNGTGSRGDESMGPGVRRILTAIAQGGQQGVTKAQLSVNTGYRRSSRDTYLQRLRSAGYVQLEGDGRHVATEAGIAALGDDYEPLPTGRALYEYWRERLPVGERNILEVVVREGKNGVVPKDVISGETGYKRSARDTYIQRLSARRLVEVNRGGVRAAEELFG